MKLTTSLFLAPALAFGLAGCDVQQTEEGELPEVDVKGGNMPKYDVEAGDIDIEKKTVTVPTLDYDSPAQDAAEEKAGKE